MDGTDSALDPQFIADHALMQLRIGGHRSKIMTELSPAERRRLALDLLDPDQDTRAVFNAWRRDGKPRFSQRGLYRFATAFAKAANRVHLQTLEGIAGPVLLKPQQVRRQLNTTQAAVDALIASGELATVDVAGETRIDPNALRTFIATHGRPRDKKGRFKAKK